MRPTGETVRTVALDPETNDYVRDAQGNLVDDPEGIEYRTCTGYERYVVGHHTAVADKFLRCPVPGKEATALQLATGLKFQNPGW